MNSCIESNKLTPLAHVNAITIGITDLRRGRYNNDALRLQAGQHADDTFPECGTPYNGIIDHYQCVNALPDSAIGDIIYVLHHLVAVHIFGDEGPHLYILDGYLLHAHFTVDHLVQLLRGHIIAPGSNTL